MSQSSLLLSNFYIMRKLMISKVILVTLEGTHNFGNRLQHYALQHAVEKCGCNVINLMVRPIPMYTKTQVKSAVKSIFVMCGIRRYRTSISQDKRTIKFLAFDKQHITNIVRMSVDEVRQTDWSSYAFAITGSDQVWHNWQTYLFRTSSLTTICRV